MPSDILLEPCRSCTETQEQEEARGYISKLVSILGIQIKGEKAELERVSQIRISQAPFQNSGLLTPYS